MRVMFIFLAIFLVFPIAYCEEIVFHVDVIEGEGIGFEEHHPDVVYESENEAVKKQIPIFIVVILAFITISLYLRKHR